MTNENQKPETVTESPQDTIVRLRRLNLKLRERASRLENENTRLLEENATLEYRLAKGYALNHTLGNAITLLYEKDLPLVKSFIKPSVQSVEDVLRRARSPIHVEQRAASHTRGTQGEVDELLARIARQQAEDEGDDEEGAE